MQSLSNIHHHQTTTDDLYAASSGGRLSLWFPTKQSRFSLPNGVVTEPEMMKTEYNFHVKLSESQYQQEQDSSSTLSTEQSSLEAATSAKRDFRAQNVSFHQPGLFETRKKRDEDYVRPCLANGTAHYISHQVQMEHHNQSLDCISYPFAGSYFGRITSAYDPNAAVYPQMMGIAPTRAVLPLDCTQGIVPIYVNAKQYHAILKRRKIRAKLEAENKMTTKSRKPYLHESRHRHALKRARGSGGRFLNTKNMQESKPPTHVFDNRDLIFQKISTTNASSSWGASTPSDGSDVSCIFNNEEDIFPQLDLGASIDCLTAPDYRLALSVDGYARIGTAN